MKTYLSLTSLATRLNIVAIFFVFLFQISYSQQYRNIDAYMEDFDKNETFIKKSLNDYTNSIVENNLDSRSESTSSRIISKLKNINSNLLKNDKGFEKNTLLRDGFIKMNQKTIEYLSNGSLILNDYEKLAPLSMTEIRKIIIQKENDIENYFQELKRYAKIRAEFATTYHLPTKKSIDKNFFEYNAYQNILFYKINIIDFKLNSYINSNDILGFNKHLSSLKEIQQEVIEKSNQLNKIYKDFSLNNKTIDYANLLVEQYTQLSPLFNNYIINHNELQNAKKKPISSTDKKSINEYNNIVRNYNQKKNDFFDTLNNLKNIKKLQNDNWYATNSSFLKRNIELSNIYQKYTDVD